MDASAATEMFDLVELCEGFHWQHLAANGGGERGPWDLVLLNLLKPLRRNRAPGVPLELGQHSDRTTVCRRAPNLARFPLE